MIVKLVPGILTIFFFISCGHKNEKTASEIPVYTEEKNNSKETGNKAEEIVINKAIKKEDYEAGKILVAGADCSGCHRIKDKLIGPAYTDIADHYQITSSIIDTLSSRIIRGSVNHWSSIPMTPHMTLLKQDAVKMIKYIFAFKKE